MSHAAFLRAIIDRPDDDTPRLVYADWLDENGDPARAEFIRVQCELGDLPEDDPRRPKLEDREHELLDANEERWVGHSGLRSAALSEWVWNRGFLRAVTADHSEMQTHAYDGYFAEHPLEKWREGMRSASHSTATCCLRPEHRVRIRSFDFSRLGFSPVDIDDTLLESDYHGLRVEELNLSDNPGITELAPALARWQVSRCLRSLAFGGRSGENFHWADAENETLDTPGFVEALSDAPLERLSAFDCGLTGDGLRLILNATFAPRFKDLDISDNRIAPDAWRAFRQAAPDLRLKRLDVSGTDLAAISLEPLLESPALENLESLEVNRCGSARPNIEAIARSKFWTQATQLRMHGGTIPALHFAPLCESTGRPALRLLDLADNYLRTDGVRYLCEAPWAGSLTWLALSRNYLDDTSLTVLADSGRFTKLRTLHLAHNNLDQDRSDGEVITDTGVRRLAATPSLVNLRVLSLGFTGVTDRSVDVLLNAQHWRLAGLGLDGCDLSPKAVAILASSPRLARLQWLSLAANPRLSGDILMPLAESPYLSRLCELDVGGVYVGERTLAALRARLGPRLRH
jgi:uncharacterized protein (TIGR02996 family)